MNVKTDVLVGQFDAKVWAEEFVKMVKDKPEIATDEGTMIGWFANAIMAGHDYALNMKAEKGKWTKEAHCELIRKNGSNVYSLMVELAAIYLKLYGELPKGIGLSGQQAEFARSIVGKLPDAEKSKREDLALYKLIQKEPTMREKIAKPKSEWCEGGEHHKSITVNTCTDEQTCGECGKPMPKSEWCECKIPQLTGSHTIPGMCKKCSKPIIPNANEYIKDLEETKHMLKRYVQWEKEARLTPKKIEKDRLFSSIKSEVSNCVCELATSAGQKISDATLNSLANKYTDKIIDCL